MESHTWDRGIDWKVEYKRLTSYLLSPNLPSRDARKAAILLIILRNGCRANESTQAYNKFSKKGERRVYVRVEKRGFKYPKGKDGKRVKGLGVLTKPYYRRVVIPNEIVTGLGPYRNTTSNLTEFAKKYFDWNPHSGRYAFVGHLQSKNIPAQTIAGITGHKTLDEILHYSSVKNAEKTLEDDVI